MRRDDRKTILLTGASAGLGAALAREFARGGHRLALVARRADRLVALEGELRDLGAETLSLPADLAAPEAAARLIDAVLSEFGRLDLLVNNAGLGLPDYFAQCDPEALRHQIAVNLTAPLLLTHHAIPHLARSGGMVINVGSGIAAVPNPILGAYGATKAGLTYWNDALRRELKDQGVRVCLVELGPVATEFFEAVVRLEGGQSALGVRPAPDGLYNAMRDRPPGLMTITPEAAARRIARLLDRPKRRLALPKRVILPFRLVGAVLRLAPGLADLAVTSMIRRVERERRSETHKSMMY